MKRKIVEKTKDLVRFYVYTIGFAIVGVKLTNFFIDKNIRELATFPVLVLGFLYIYFYDAEDKEIKKNRKHEIKTNMEAE